MPQTLRETADAAYAGLVGNRILLDCDSGPPEVAVAYLFAPGAPSILFVTCGVYNEEDLFYVETALGAVELAPTVP